MIITIIMSSIERLPDHVLAAILDPLLTDDDAVVKLTWASGDRYSLSSVARLPLKVEAKHSAAKSRNARKRFMRRSFRLGLLTVCSKFRAAGKKIFYDKLEFVFRAPRTFSTILSSPTMSFRNEIKHLVLAKKWDWDLESKERLRFWPSKCHFHNGLQFLKRMPSLESVKLVYDAHRDDYERVYGTSGWPARFVAMAEEVCKKEVEDALQKEWGTSNLSKVPFPEVVVNFHGFDGL